MGLCVFSFDDYGNICNSSYHHYQIAYESFVTVDGYVVKQWYVLYVLQYVCFIILGSAFCPGGHHWDYYAGAPS